MKIIYPEGAMGLLELLAENEAEKIWRNLTNGQLLAWRWVADTGDILEVAPKRWLGAIKVIEQGGDVVKRHPVELLENGKLGWFMPPLWPGHDNSNDLIIVNEICARQIFPKKHSSTDQGGRPEHPAKEWYAERGFSRGGLTLGALQTEMKNATGVEPPSQSTIRNWEKEAQKPPAKT